MLTTKRVFIATVCGIVFGIVCMLLASSNPQGGMLTTSVKLNIILSRTLTGFMIGISAIRLKWWLHGIILGFIGSLPMAVAMLGQTDIMIGSVVMGIIYAFLIELITTVLFKAKSASSS